MAKNKKQRTRKREQKYVPQGKAYINATFNNTLISMTDMDGNVVIQRSAGMRGASGAAGFKGSRKATSYAAQQAGFAAATAAMEHGMHTVHVLVKGPGSGRESAIRALQAAGMRVVSIKDATPMAHNGCRPRKKPRG